ncbi:MAG: BrxA/BrxB family bacilliredoxin [Acidobacteria bacterium]|nr:BrxA/BrxB family bacilliredoxin [Acidobacteriota bacterium]
MRGKRLLTGDDPGHRPADELWRIEVRGVYPRGNRERSVGLFKDGVLVYALERRHIERMTPDDVARELVRAFGEHCTGKGPSVPADVYGQVVHARQCGSQIPRFVG